MGESAEELRRDIEETRGVSPTRSTRSATGSARAGSSSAARTAWSRACSRSATGSWDRPSDARDSVAGGTSTAVDTVKDAPDVVRHQTQGSPVAAGAIAFGVGFLVAAILPGRASPSSAPPKG